MFPNGNIYIYFYDIFLTITYILYKNMGNKKDSQIRELPKSLLGIETILLYLDKKNKELLSIRNISESTGLSMRVTKNILLQLERLKQLERVVVKNNILPKWRITKFGKKVIKEAQGIQKKTKFPTREDELLNNILIPADIESVSIKIKENKEAIISQLKSMQLDLSKMLGTVLNLNDPIFEDLLSVIIKQIKHFRQRVSNLSSDPLATSQLKIKDEKQKKYSKEEIRNLLIEIFFFDSVIFNEVDRIIAFNKLLSQMLENEEYSKGYSTAKDLREEIRLLSVLISKRETIKINSHVLSNQNLNSISKNKINSDILYDIIEIPISNEVQSEEIKDLILKQTVKLNKGAKQVSDFSGDIRENIPLYAFYQLILDEKPNFTFTIEKLEEIINSLADEGYLPGIKIIQEDEDHYLKLVQFNIQDFSENELELISKALKFQSFSLTDIVGATGWSTNQVVKILNHLTEVGILKYSKNHLHGERWFIVSEQ